MSDSSFKGFTLPSQEYKKINDNTYLYYDEKAKINVEIISGKESAEVVAKNIIEFLSKLYIESEMALWESQNDSQLL